MALIPCDECGSQVSTRAATCPKCGAPVVPVVKAEQEAIGTPLLTTQLTSKALKKQQVFASLLVLVSIVGALAGSSAYPAVAALCVLGLLGGLIWLLVVRMRIWWHHG